MGKTMLVAGKDAPAGEKFAESLANTGRFVVITESDSEANAERSVKSGNNHKKMLSSVSGVASVEWNRASPVSCRAVLLNAENIFTPVQDAVLYFDEDFYASRASQLDIEECSQNCDDMILSYQYMTLELLSRFQQKKDQSAPNNLVFLLKDSPSLVDALKNPSLHNGIYAIASPTVAAATNAFEAFAENVAVLYGDLQSVNIFLVRCDRSSGAGGISHSDISLAKWLVSYLDAFNGQKAKKSATWIKPGAKPPSSSGFSLFKKDR